MWHQPTIVFSKLDENEERRVSCLMLAKVMFMLHARGELEGVFRDYCSIIEGGLSNEMS